ncbi:hypothetical protein PG993_003252 [Apiospora rasikravindrae]|uniref:FAD-binding PCMH-type domain-containing protein n=1 Tax=Apiospora rasikravindrae TaxID=990691 RepID=A0ABR1TZ16_9PEZI
MDHADVKDYANKGDGGSLGGESVPRRPRRPLVPKDALPGDAAYGAELSHYWSKSLADLRPACVVQPVTVEQVAAVVRVLNHQNHTSVPFAVKSGGHDPNPGHASVDGGVLIALHHMKGTRYDAEKGVAYVKPGESIQSFLCLTSRST